MVKAICVVARGGSDCRGPTQVSFLRSVDGVPSILHSAAVLDSGPRHERLHWGRSRGGGDYSGGGGGGGGSAALHACPVQSIAGAPAAD